MPSSWSPSLRLELQFTGEQINLWGDRLNVDLQHVDYAIAGWLTKALTGDYTLTSANAGDDEARAAMLKFTGAGPFTVTIPSVSKWYFIWNVLAGLLTVTTGAGATVVLESGTKLAVFCDGTNVNQSGYGGLGLKDYIDSAVLAATGSLPAVTGNAGKFVYCDGVTWLPRLALTSDLYDIVTYTAAQQAFAVAVAVAL